QGMILEEHGYTCPEGILYFVGSKERVRVVFDDDLRAMTQAAVDGLRLIAAGGQIPPPLEDSPKCPRCSLVNICLPDEVNFLKQGEPTPRPLFPQYDEGLPLYVQTTRSKRTKKGETHEITIEDQPAATTRLSDVSQLVLMGNVYVTTPCLHELMRREIPVTWLSYGGWFLGHSVGLGHKNVELRTAQYKASFDPRACLHIARQIVHAKIMNCRTLIRRNWRGDDRPDVLVSDLKLDANRSLTASGIQELLGIEGASASRYFRSFARLLKTVPVKDFLDTLIAGNSVPARSGCQAGLRRVVL